VVACSLVTQCVLLRAQRHTSLAAGLLLLNFLIGTIGQFRQGCQKWRTEHALFLPLALRGAASDEGARLGILVS
jgi:hypothetical protein